MNLLVRAIRRVSPLAILPALALALGAVGCIERPYQDTPQARGSFDRAAVRDALVSGVPTDTIPVGALFGNAVELVGYRVEPAALVPGQRARITLYWRCIRPLDAWHIFVHLDDATGASPERIHAEHDPVQGRFPTDAWRPGDLIADPFIIQAGSVPLNVFSASTHRARAA